MCHSQRQKSIRRQRDRKIIESFVDNALALTVSDVDRIYSPLAVDLGFMLSPDALELRRRNPPTSPNRLAAKVIELEGLGAGGDLYYSVLEVVVDWFQRLAADAQPDFGCQSMIRTPVLRSAVAQVAQLLKCPFH